jgi:hypothetical protein
MRDDFGSEICGRSVNIVDVEDLAEYSRINHFFRIFEAEVSRH